MVILQRYVVNSLCKMDTFFGLAPCVRLFESRLKGVEKKVTNSKCPIYKGANLIEVSVKRTLTVSHDSTPMECTSH